MFDFSITDLLSNVITSVMAIPVFLWFLTPKFKRSTTAIAASIYCVLISLFMMQFVVFLDKNNLNVLIEPISFLFSVPFIFLFKDKIIKRIIVVLSTKIGAGIISLPPIILLQSLNMLDSTTIRGVIVIGFTVAAFFLLVSRLIFRITTKSLKKNHITRALLVFVPSLVWLDLLSQYPLFIVEPYKQIENINSILNTVFNRISDSAFIYILATVSLVISFYIVIKYLELQQIKNQELELKNKENLNIEYQEIVTENIKRAKDIQQSLSNELDSLIHSIENNQKPQISNENIKEKINEITAIRFCDNKTINSVLVSKYTLATKLRCKVEINVSIDNKIKIDEYDFIKVIFNIFDNAINATKVLDENNRRIKFIINASEKNINILCENTFNPDIKNLKNDEHGYGMIIIKDIADKYNGIFDTSINKNVFTSSFIV